MYTSSADEQRATSGLLARPVHIPIGRNMQLEGDLSVSEGAPGVVLFAHGGGSNRHSERNRLVARSLRRAGLGTLLFNLLTPEEEQAERVSRHLRSDVPLLTSRLLAATQWLRGQPAYGYVPVGYFGSSSTGAAAALRAAAQSPEGVRAVVCRGGRPDLVGELITKVQAPTLLLVGAYDDEILAHNRRAYMEMRCPKRLEIVPGASHLFEEAGAMKRASELATSWFAHLFTTPRSSEEEDSASADA